MKKHPILILAAVLVVLMLYSMTIGRYPMTVGEIVNALHARLAGGELTYRQDEILFLLKDIRLPRVLAAVLVGAALSSSGAVYQAMFINPLVSPSILGTLAGASFGAAIGIVVLNSWIATQALAFVFACVAVALAVLLSFMLPRSTLLVLVLGGMVSSAFFKALTSLMKYVADPQSQLPELTYWLMGSFANTGNHDLMRVGFIILVGVIIMCVRGKLLNVMSIGDEEAMALGISVRRKRLELIALATFVSASTVVIAGTIQWVGLLIPHMVRFIIGPDNRVLLPCAAIGGGVFMLATDSLVRSAFTVEVPIGIVASLICLPLFVFALYQNKGKWR